MNGRQRFRGRVWGLAGGDEGESLALADDFVVLTLEDGSFMAVDYRALEDGAPWCLMPADPSEEMRSTPPKPMPEGQYYPAGAYGEAEFWTGDITSIEDDVLIWTDIGGGGWMWCIRCLSTIDFGDIYCTMPNWGADLTNGDGSAMLGNRQETPKTRAIGDGIDD